MLARIPLCCLPTPCHSLERLGADLGLELWVKRDDLTGFAGGGNKGRKLEYLMAEAVAEGAQRVVTCGSKQSNFVRQLGAACSVLGISCTAVVMELPFDKGHGKPVGQVPVDGGNAKLDALFGVELRLVEDGDWLDLFRLAHETAQEYRSKGEKVVEIPVGGSSPLGAYAFAQAAVEVGEGWDAVVVPTSSGSTHAGLAWAFSGSRTRVVGIACDPEEDLRDDLLRLTDGIDQLAGFSKKMTRDAFEICRDWVGPGYNVWSDEAREAIQTAAMREGLLLDPVYSGKAFAGLLGLARSGDVSGRVLFWHTGGLPTLLATCR